MQCAPFLLFLSVLFLVFSNKPDKQTSRSRFLLGALALGVGYLTFRHFGKSLNSGPPLRLRLRLNKGKEDDKEHEQYCAEMTSDNPNANPSLSRPNEIACKVDYDDPAVNQRYTDLFLSGVPLSHWDVYGKNTGIRQFYTIPHNDQSAFAHFLYDPSIVMRCERTQKAC
eukprot:265988-Prorocentrum_minimum.AAC.11